MTRGLRVVAVAWAVVSVALYCAAGVVGSQIKMLVYAAAMTIVFVRVTNTEALPRGVEVAGSPSAVRLWVRPGGSA